jgi:hypothetical protein
MRVLVSLLLGPLSRPVATLDVDLAWVFAHPAGTYCATGTGQDAIVLRDVPCLGGFTFEALNGPVTVAADGISGAACPGSGVALVR